MQRVTLEITGMHCGHCEHAVRHALAAVPGVKVDRVEIGTAVVDMDETIANVGALIDAVDDAGYEAREAAA